MDDLDFTGEAQDKYLELRGVYHIKVDEYRWSKDIEGYNKTPFVRFKVHDTTTKMLTSFVLWMPVDGEKPERTKIKRKLFKEFFENLGCNMIGEGGLKGRDLLDCTIGKECKVALREKERVILLKKDGRPMVVSDLDYYYSGTVGKPLTCNESKMVLPLTPKMREDFESSLAAWKATNEPNAGASAAPTATPTTEVADEDWPF